MRIDAYTSLVAILCLSEPVAAQVTIDPQQFHDRAVAFIARMAGRPLTPGDTFFTWNPDPGGMIHTVQVSASAVSSSLLRGGDGMIGTARVDWTNGIVQTFEIRWTRPDPGGKGLDSAIFVAGERTGEHLQLRTGGGRAVPIPGGRWAVADYGMEEQLIPLIRALPRQAARTTVSVFRPYHLKWDTVFVSIRDTLGLRLAEITRTENAHELMVIDAEGALLWIFRFDQPGERRPLEGTNRYLEYARMRPTLDALRSEYARPSAPGS